MKIKTICRKCRKRALLVKGHCKNCEKQLGAYAREVLRQESVRMAALVHRGWM